MNLTRRHAVTGVLGAALAASSLSGCGLFSGETPAATPQAKGVLSTPRGTAGASPGASAGTPLASGSARASGTAQAGTGTGQASASPIPTLRPKPGASGLPCNAEGLVLHLSQASGAVHAYLAKPGQNAPATVVALKSATTRATGARAASYAAGQLGTGLAAASGCATTSALGSVAKQTAGYLTSLSKKLAADTASTANVSAAEALIADVNAQAGRAGLKITDRVVAANLLK